MSLVFPLLSTSSWRNCLFIHNDWENAWRPSNGLGGVGYTHPKDVKSHDQGLSPRRLHIKGASLYRLGLRPQNKVSSEREYESKRGLPYPGGIGRIVFFFPVHLRICKARHNENLLPQAAHFPPHCGSPSANITGIL